MAEFVYKGLLLENGWMENAVVNTDDRGVILSLEQDRSRNDAADFAIPGFQNAHSHAFQYAMAGLAEQHPLSKDKNDFWSWRKLMYQLALTITPDQLEDVACMLYKEMLRHGYTHVAEFHYLHHDSDGNRYGNIAEMGERLLAAAERSGINITLVPIFYQMGGFGKAPEKGQRRFISRSIDDYQALFDASEKLSQQYSFANVAYGIHSLRAVSADDIIHLSANRSKGIPLHIHVSEQLKEIEDSVEYLGLRPVEWLVENTGLSEDHHLVHATHITSEEIRSIAENKANVVLCPSTEGNLGDGLFPLGQFLKESGKWSIGTDSHVGLNPFEELRILDYGQRLITHNRNTFGTSISGDNGNLALTSALINGRAAMGSKQQGFFEIGTAFDALVVSQDHPVIGSTSLKNLSNTLVYSSDPSMYRGTVVNGSWVIQDGEHQDEDIHSRFMRTINELKVR